jgi:ABC-type anion transport system duplicated permease subunit
MGGGYDHALNPAVRVLVVLAIAAAFSLLIGGLLGTRHVAHLFQLLRHG